MIERSRGINLLFEIKHITLLFRPIGAPIPGKPGFYADNHDYSSQMTIQFSSNRDIRRGPEKIVQGQKLVNKHNVFKSWSGIYLLGRLLLGLKFLQGDGWY